MINVFPRGSGERMAFRAAASTPSYLFKGGGWTGSSGVGVGLVTGGRNGVGPNSCVSPSTGVSEKTGSLSM